jgi:hypothetical protein
LLSDAHHQPFLTRLDIGLAHIPDLGLARRIIQRSGAWELLHCPTSLQDTILAFNRVAPRISTKNDNVFVSIAIVSDCIPVPQTVSPLLSKLEQRWANLSPI